MSTSVFRNAVYTTIRAAYKGVVFEIQIVNRKATPAFIQRARNVASAALIELMDNSEK